MVNKDHQHATPFDDGGETERLPEDLRQIAQRYATLPVPRPTPEETSKLIARLQAPANHDPSSLSVSPLRRRRRVIPLLEVLAGVLIVGALVSSFFLVLASRLHRPTAPSAGITGRPVTLQTLRMFDAANGWATMFAGFTAYGSRHVLHTSKGMLHWQDVSPERIAQSNGQGLVEVADFMNARTAWVVFDPHPVSSGPTPHPLFVERTTDGGKTWSCRTGAIFLSCIVPMMVDTPGKQSPPCPPGLMPLPS